MNITVSGNVGDLGGFPLENYRVDIITTFDFKYDIKTLSLKTEEEITDSDGNFSITYDPWDVFVGDTPPEPLDLEQVFVIIYNEDGDHAAVSEKRDKPPFSFNVTVPKRIVFSQTAFPEKFKCLHHVHTRTADDKELVTLTGIVLVDVEGASGWHRENLRIRLRIPDNIIPTDPSFFYRRLRIEQCAPFFTINSISNKGQAKNAGWAVDEFWGPGSITIRAGDELEFRVRVAVRDTDAWLFRIGYNISLLGRLVSAADTADATGLKLFEDGGKGIFIKDSSGFVGIGTTDPTVKHQ